MKPLFWLMCSVQTGLDPAKKFLVRERKDHSTTVSGRFRSSTRPTKWRVPSSLMT